MHEITINLTDEQKYYLQKFALKHCEGSKDNVGTHNPIHLVQTQDERVVDPDFVDPDKVIYHVPDWAEDFETIQELITAYWDHKGECPIEIVDFSTAYAADEFIDVNGEERVIMDEEDYLEAYGVDKGFYYKVSTVFDYRTVAVFFILNEAKKYLEYQSHNLTNPRTYTIGAGYANKGEYHDFWELLFSIGKQLNNEEEKACKR